MKQTGDDAGAESIAPILIFVFCFFVLGSFLIGLMHPMFTSGEQVNEGLVPAEMLGDVSVGATWNPTDGFDTNWTDVEDSTLDYQPWEAYPNAYSYGTWAVTMLNVRNNTEYLPGSSSWWEKHYDFLAFKDNWGVCSVISYGSIENSTEYSSDGTVYALIYPGGPLNATTGVLITFEDDSDEDDVNEQLYDLNTFNVGIAWIIYGEWEDTEVSWYTIAFKMLTFQGDYTGTDFDVIINVIMAVMVAFAVFTLFTRFAHGG